MLAAVRIAILPGLALSISVMALGPVQAQDVRITEDRPFVETVIAGKTIRIERIQDQEYRLSSDFTKTSRPCPPFCIHPMKVAEGVETLGELELLDFITKDVSGETGLLIDARIPVWYRKGTIPAAINVPFTLFDPENPFHGDIIQALGGVKNGGGWDFTRAKSLSLFCNGPWCDQSPRAIRNLLSAGYPPEKLFYYRGGMQAWQAMGLSIVVPRPEPVAASAREKVGAE